MDYSTHYPRRMLRMDRGILKPGIKNELFNRNNK